MILLNTFIRFTRSEFNFIEDRLFGVPDAIAEALDIDISVVESIVVHDQTKRSVTLFVPRAAFAALADCAEGSTLLYRAEDRKRERAIIRAGDSAARKIRDAGIECGDQPL